MKKIAAIAMISLLATALAEPFFYPMHTLFAVIGNIESLWGKQGWGKAKRSGFEKKKLRIRKPSTVRQSANIVKGASPDSTT